MSFRVFVVVGVQQAMQVHDVIPHMRVVHRALGFAPPGPGGLGVVGINAYDIQSVEVSEFGSVGVQQPPAENQVEELLGHTGNSRVRGLRTRAE